MIRRIIRLIFGVSAWVSTTLGKQAEILILSNSDNDKE